jgi:hypothetical protein
MRGKPRCEPRVHCGPRLGIERGGKINASSSCSDYYTGSGVVAGCWVGRFSRHWPHLQPKDIHWRSKCLQTLQEVSPIGKTRDQLHSMEFKHDLPSYHQALCQPCRVVWDMMISTQLYCFDDLTRRHSVPRSVPHGPPTLVT